MINAVSDYLFKMGAWNGSLVPSAIALAKSRVCKP